jgi:sortase A
MKRFLLVSALAIIGIALFAYPYVASYVSGKGASKAIQKYSDAVWALDGQTVADQWKKARRYNNELAGDPVYDPFVPGSGTVRSQDYANILNVNGMMGYISIPKINVRLTIRHGTSDETLRTGIGHLEGTSLPVGGRRTHAVLTGHSGLTHARLFTDLVELKEEDTFYLHILDKILAYRVDQIKVVTPSNTTDLGLMGTGDYVTLITCTPYGVNSHRLLVRGAHITYNPDEENRGAKQKTPRPTREERILLLAGIPTAALMLFLIFITLQRKRRAHKPPEESRYP